MRMEALTFREWNIKLRASAVKPVLVLSPRRLRVNMQAITLFFLAALAATTYAAGQYYVPRSYYIIDSDGHESPPVPLRRLRRSPMPYPSPNFYPGAGSSANANANANAEARSWGGGDATANANANARASAGGWDVPSPIGYGASNPALGAGH